MTGSGSGGCLRGRLTSYASAVVSAPPDIVWKTVIDIDANPSNISSVASVERIDGSNKGDIVKTGTRWKETRVHRGAPIVQTKTVAFMGTEEGGGAEGGGARDGWPKSFSLNVGYGPPFEGDVNTSTLTVQPYRDDEGGGAAEGDEKEARRTLLSGTFAFVADRFLDRIRIRFTVGGSCCRTKKRVTALFQREIDELAAAAESYATGGAPLPSPGREPPASSSPSLQA